MATTPQIGHASRAVETLSDAVTCELGSGRENAWPRSSARHGHDASSDHVLRRSLAPAQLRALTRRSDRAGLSQLAGHVAAIAATSCWIVFRLPGWPLAILLQGVLLVFLFTPMHECIHRTAFATRWLNDAVAAICGALLLLSPEWFRRFHLEHHRHTQDPARDPELAVPRPGTRWRYVVHVSGLPVWRSAVGTLLVHAVNRGREPFLSPAARRRVTAEARGLLALYALLALVSVTSGLSAVLTLWLLPVLLGQPFLRLYLLAEHGNCPFVADMLVNTRTTFTNAAVRALSWNMSYHAEHHALPAVPFYRLPELHRLARRHLRTTTDGYLRFNEHYARQLPR